MRRGTTPYRNGDVANMFYWSNVFHDRLYTLGFTEAARNFQNDNFGRGGSASDRVLAQGQDFSSVNNANFLTLPDGNSGRLQMFVFTGPTPDRSSGLDAEVMLHELTHGLSSRIHGNASGLSYYISEGMAEGWSDFFARALLSTADEDPDAAYAPAAWLTQHLQGGFTDNYYYGLRRFPYASRHRGGANGRPFNPLTFADLATTPDLGDGAYPPSPIGSADGLQPHRIGEVWASALFEVRARYIARLGFAVGNQRLLQYVVDAMKMESTNPSFLMGRDALLAAVYASGGSTPDADAADIWAGFAARGMGVLAAETAQALPANESFAVPGQEPTLTVDDLYLAEGNSGTRAFAFNVRRHSSDGAPARVRFRTSWNGSADQGARFINANQITINDNVPASPYPKQLFVSGVTGAVDQISIDVGVRHDWTGDIDMLLVSPAGQRLMLMSDVMEHSTPESRFVTIMDGAPPFPQTTDITDQQTYFAPTDYAPGETLPAPAPGAPTIATFAGFTSSNPNGMWQLFVVDDNVSDTGVIGNSNLLVTTPDTADYIPKAGEAVFPAGVDVAQAVVMVYGDAVSEPNEILSIALFDPTNALIADTAGRATIINDDGGAPLPTTVADAFATAFNTALTVPGPGVLANDISNDPYPLTAFLFTAPAHGALNLSTDGGFIYTPAAGYIGGDTFTYRALNIYGQSSATTVALTVSGPPVPTSAGDQFDTAYLTPLSVGAPGVLANDAANGAPAMSAALVSGPARGTVSLAANGAFTYTPQQYFAGTDTFTYRATSVGGAGNVASVTIVVAQPTELQAPYDLQAWSVNGSEVTLRWTMPPVGPVPTGFVVEGGLAPGQVLASLPTNSTAPIYTFTAPPGSFSLRVHALAGGTRTAASNEIPLHVNVPVTPAAPTGLLGLVNGSDITLAWKNVFSGGPPSTVILDVAGSAALSIPLGNTEAFSFAGVPPGTYTLSLRAANAGGTSPSSSNPVTLTFPGGCSGAPGPPTDALAYLLGNTGHVIWGPPASGPAPSLYTLSVSGSFTGAFSTPGRQLSGAVAPGVYNLALAAVNPCGASAPVNMVLSVP